MYLNTVYFGHGAYGLESASQTYFGTSAPNLTLSQSATLAGVLASQGVAKGDRVLIYMPMIPEAVVAMLATARLGAVHSLVFGGFAPRELATPDGIHQQPDNRHRD